MTIKRIILTGIAGSLAGLCLAADAPAVHTKVFLSPVYTINKLYRSMEGPMSTERINLLDTPTPELLWVTGFRTEMVADDGETPSKPEYMCHVNLDFDEQKYRNLMGAKKNQSGRLLTLSQGQLSATFPPGFGFPIISNQPLSLTTQVLNLNDPALKTTVRHKVTIQFVRDRDLKTPMKPLFNVTPFVMTPIDPTPTSETAKAMAAMPAMHGDSCLPGAPAPAGTHQQAPNAVHGSTYKDDRGRSMTGHWVVPPGRSEEHTDVTEWMDLPFDTRLHFAAIHVHPYAQSLELRDLTTHKTVFKSMAHNRKVGIGLDAVDNYSSVEGKPLFKSHKYELISVYNNPTSVNSDSMAVMLLFLYDKEFKKPMLDSFVVSAPSAAPISSVAAPRIVMHTPLGDLTLLLDPASAPRTTSQFTELARSGAYDGVPLIYVQQGFLAQFSQVRDRSLPLTPAQLMYVRPLPLEPGGRSHTRGVLSMARMPDDENSGESSFNIMFGNAANLDRRYTTFGRIIDGGDVLRSLERLAVDAQNKPREPLRITRMDVIDTATGAAIKPVAEKEPEAPLCHATGNEPAGAPVGKAAKAKPFGAYIPSRGDNLVIKDAINSYGEKSKEVLFKNLLIDRIYPSMLGPWTRAYLRLEDSQKSPTVWITGYRAEVFENGTGEASQEFMCHTKIDTVPTSIPLTSGGVQSFFVISQGQKEIRFPEGFALRLSNPPDRQIDLNAMVLNNNDPMIHKNLDFKATISYLDEAAAHKKKMVPLTLVSGSVYCPTVAGSAPAGAELCEAATDEGPDAKVTGHWLVPPGRHTYSSLYPLTSTVDSSIHYILMHVHPYAESITLRDRASGKAVWTGRVKNDPKEALILSTDHYSSAQGLPILKDHPYDIQVVYNNTTTHPVDAMASLWAYVRATP